VRIDVWGTLRVSVGGRVIGPRDFPGVKPKQLLEILIAERGHAVSKSRLADLLWGDALPRNYTATLETYVSVLRQTLEPGVRARESVVMTEPGGYRLDAERTTLDIEEFDALVQSTAGRQPLAALDTLTAALSLVRGQVFEDEPYSAWVEHLRSSYARKQLQVLVDAGRLSLITGEAAAAVSLAEQAVSLDPLAESAYQVLMTASYALWRQEDALRAFDRCRKLLADELGVDPLDETVALHLAILRHEDVAGMMAHREPVTASAVAPGPAVGLLGRSAELSRLEAAVTRSMEGCFTLLLVVGDSGMGKTRLAEALVERVGVQVGSNRCSDLEAELPYVALSLALRPVLQARTDSPMLVVTELLRRADMAQPFDQFARMRVMESLAEVVEHQSPFLLVLDDAHWADADTIATLGYLRRRCPTTPVTVLLTADRVAAQREPLRRIPADLRIELSELTAEDLAPLGAGAHEATQGHPLFVTDWLEAGKRGLQQGFTPALEERVITRCWDFGPHAYRLLSVAAVLDEPFSPSVLGQLVGASREAVEELEALVDEGMLVAVGQGFRFRHSLVRTILAGTSSEARRSRLVARAEVLALGSPRRRCTDTDGSGEQAWSPLRRVSGDAASGR
jgi:DNA-binding SARP family transcriptional activator/CheY-like chemotaxis protein